MDNTNILKTIEQIEKQLAYLKKQLKGTPTQDQSPLSKAIKTITGGHSTTEEVKGALQTLIDTPQPLSPKQLTFCLFFAMLNHNELGEDINYFFDLELGKHNYKERTKLIEQVRENINTNYTKCSTQFNQRINNYLISKEK